MNQPPSDPGMHSVDDFKIVLQSIATRATYLQAVTETAMKIIDLLKEDRRIEFVMVALKYIGGDPPKKAAKVLEQDLKDIYEGVNPQEGKVADFDKCAVWLDKIKQALLRKCKCRCDYLCSCKCSCECSCTCRSEDECKRNCRPHPSRNLVVSIDGTSNQFGEYNTNVVELHSRIIKDDHDENEPQLTYYNSGIGTYAPSSSRSLTYWKQRISNISELMFAWNFEEIVRGAYQWLANHYQPGDKIYLFGFSRGAYQVRALAGMIEKVGLVFHGNQEQIPFAFELYANRYKGKVRTSTDEMARRFKETFSRSIRVHFLGAWDTVSSVGVLRQKVLPLTGTCDHICFFRHALALDERRVKFLPEYLNRENLSSNRRQGRTEEIFSPVSPPPRIRPRSRWDSFTLNPLPRPNIKDKNVEMESNQPSRSHHERRNRHAIHSKEVWFAGSHSDIGGGNKPNLGLNLASIPLIWMENEAITAGLRLKPRPFEDGWNIDKIQKDKITESLFGCWWILEIFPIKRLTYHDSESTTSNLHFGKGRKIVPGQQIHASVAFKESRYNPRAQVISSISKIKWESLVGTGKINDISWTRKWEGQLEMDIFDRSLVQEIVEELKQNGIKSNGLELSVDRLRFTALFSDGAKAIGEPGLQEIVKILKIGSDSIKATCVSCIAQLAKHLNIQEALTKHHAVLSLVKLLKDDILELKDDGAIREAQFNSLDCLSWCFSGSLPVSLPLARREIIQNVSMISAPLLEMLGEQDTQKQCRSASCLFRLVQDTDIRNAILTDDIVTKLVDALTRMFEIDDYESRRISAVNLSKLAKHESVRDAMKRFNTIGILTRSLKHNQPFAQFWAGLFLSRFGLYDDIRDKIIPDIYTDLLKGVNSKYLAVGAACAVSLVEFVAHKNSREAIIKAGGVKELTLMLHNRGAVISISKALEQIEVPANAMTTSNGQTGKLQSGAAVLSELSKHNDAVSAILEAATIPATINLFKSGDSALQLYGASFLRNIVEHEPACANIQINMINELAGMLTSPDRLIIVEASKTLIEFAKYGHTRKLLLEIDVNLFIGLISTTQSSGIGLLAELAKHDDATIIFAKPDVLQSLTNILKQHINNSKPRRLFSFFIRRHGQLAVVKVFAELAKRDSVTVVKDTKTILFPEDEIKVLIHLLQDYSDEMVAVASTALDELARKSEDAMTAINKQLKEVLAPMITGPDPRVRAIAARSITELTKYGDKMLKFIELDEIEAFAEVLENETEDGGDNDVDLALMPINQEVVNKLFFELEQYEITRSLMLKVPTLVNIYFKPELPKTDPSPKV